MPPKKKTPAPIDRPLSKAYLREFKGWSTAYPPGLSDPNSLRVMENVQITREGAARVRPGLRSFMRTKSQWPLVGSHELFYMPNGKAYLVAVREMVDVGTEDEREIVGFRVIMDTSDPTEGEEQNYEMVTLDSEEAGFEIANDSVNDVSFTGATTYVRYLQIDNKIFALSDTPEPMVMFWVGKDKKAKRLESIIRPKWEAGDKLSVRQPDGAWLSGQQPSNTRTNLCTNPDFETNTAGWYNKASLMSSWHSTAKYVGSRSLGMRSLESRANWARSPLYNPSSTGLSGWNVGPRINRINVEGSAMRIHAARQDKSSFGYAMSNRLPVPGGKSFNFAFDLTYKENARKWMTAVRFFRSNGDQIGSTTQVGGNTNLATGRKYSKPFTIPSQAASMRILIGVAPKANNVNAKIGVKNVTLNQSNVSTAALDGSDGTDYYWEGTVNNSRSLHHPGRDIWVESYRVGASPGTYTGSAYLHGSSGKTIQLQTLAFNSSGTLLAYKTGTATGTGSWQQVQAPALSAPSGTTRVCVRAIMRDADRANRLYVDAVLLERAGTHGAYFSGATPNGTTANWRYRWLGTTHNSQSRAEEFVPVLPNPETPTDSTLVSSSSSRNQYSVGFFYTISNELGESAASQVSVVRVQRPWTQWLWKTTSGSSTDNPLLCADQLVSIMPQEVFDAAVAAGAVKWTLYMYTWGPNDPPPVTAIKITEIDLSNEPDYIADGVARMTPQLIPVQDIDPLVPTESTLYNASDPSKGSQGLVAADRLILVGDPDDPARITWSSGAPGEYENFSPALGGGTKQLTSGNLYVTANVQLWQNPQSVDTLTILNLGDDGRSNAYYMQPTTITTLSETIQAMGFEEVTSMRGTISPYGCEVVNNGLYRPTYHALLKSTANNYTISTKSVSDDIANVWRTLQQPHRIVSSNIDNRIYFLVHNIFGDILEEGCRGNEVWVMDLAAKTPTWSRWKVQGNSLRAMDIDKVVMMSVVRPDGIFALHEDRYTDETFDDAGTLVRRNIPWYLETNTQGANRAHDAWANLQQANVMLGNFLGQMRYGIRGKDVNGMDIDMEKQVVSSAPPPDGIATPELEDVFLMPTLNPTDRDDYFLVRKMMKEWFFYAGSIDDSVVQDEGLETEFEERVPRFSGGQINAVQYRYTPATVNVGYEYGSVETFEYASMRDADAITDSGTPKPYVDLSRP